MVQGFGCSPWSRQHNNGGSVRTFFPFVVKFDVVYSNSSIIPGSDFSETLTNYVPVWCTADIIEYFFVLFRTIEEVRNLLGGSQNTPVTLKFFRPNTNSNFEITLFRKLFRNGDPSPKVSLYLVSLPCKGEIPFILVNLRSSIHRSLPWLYPLYQDVMLECGGERVSSEEDYVPAS